MTQSTIQTAITSLRLKSSSHDWEHCRLVHGRQVNVNHLGHYILANVFSERELTFTFAISCRPSVVCLSVTLVYPTQPAEIF